MGRVLFVLVALTIVLAAACAGGEEETAGAVDLERGRELFVMNCAACHGTNAQGSLNGPPLVHEIYEPGHHPDELFQRAVAEGSPQHHWEFGPMPPVPGLSEAEVADITAYVRELQREAGIID
jgi:mono/diheme cytochrome c family protein